MLDGTPDGDALFIGSCEKRVRFDGEVRHHRKRVVVLDHAVGPHLVDVAPSERPGFQGVRARQRAGFSERWILDERRVGIESRVNGKHRRQFFVINVYQRSRVLGRIHALGRHGGDRFTEELRLANGQHRPVGEDWSVAWHGLWQVPGRHDAAHTADGCGLRAVDALDAGARAGQRDELDVEDVVEPQIGGVALRARDAFDAADTSRRPSDPARVRHRIDSAAFCTAWMIRL